MNPALASSLNWLLLIALILGNFVIKPAGGLVFHLIVAGLAAMATILSHKRSRIVGGVIMAISLALAALRYPEYKAAEERYRRNMESVTKELLKPVPKSAGASKWDG